MNLNELMKMLKMKRIMPNHVSKSQVWSAFKSANADHSQSHSSNTNQHEMDFSEFMDCMGGIHNVYKDMKEDFGDEVLCAGGESGGTGGGWAGRLWMLMLMRVHIHKFCATVTRHKHSCVI
jgi:hypothetical protein